VFCDREAHRIFLDFEIEINGRASLSGSGMPRVSTRSEGRQTSQSEEGCGASSLFFRLSAWLIRLAAPPRRRLEPYLMLGDLLYIAAVTGVVASATWLWWPR
jgi:hypothetical protein